MSDRSDVSVRFCLLRRLCSARARRFAEVSEVAKLFKPRTPWFKAQITASSPLPSIEKRSPSSNCNHQQCIIGNSCIANGTALGAFDGFCPDYQKVKATPMVY